MDNKNPLDGFTSGSGKNPPVTPAPDSSPGIVGVMEYNAATGETKILGDSMSQLPPEVKDALRKLLGSEEPARKDGKRACVHSYDRVLEVAHQLTQIHDVIKKMAAANIAKFGHCEGNMRVREWIHGAATTICWVMGLAPADPMTFLKTKIEVNAEWACSDPECESCMDVRAHAKPTDVVPPLGVKKK